MIRAELAAVHFYRIIPIPYVGLLTRVFPQNEKEKTEIVLKL